MFAVKGWNLDATSLKPQTKPFEERADASSGKSQSRKRKRDFNRDGDQSNARQEALEAEQQPQDQKAIKQKQKKSNDKPREKKPRVTDTEHDSTSTKHDRSHTEPKPKSKSDKTDAAKTTAPGKDNHHDESITGKASTQHLKQPKTKDSTGDSSIGISTTQKKSAPKYDAKPSTSSALSTTKLTPMQAAMRQKLVSARFRHLNETLYTAPSQQAQELFNANPNMFEEYHAGFRQQVAVWPENPVDKMLQKLRERGSIRLPKQKNAFKGGRSGAASSQAESPATSNTLPRSKGVCTVADCGCGDARLAQTLKSSNDLQRLNLSILSYDLHSPSPHVIKADIAALPLADGSVDVVIFCLALMGTNWLSFIEEAYRVLRWKGELWIAEIKSRFGRAEKKKAGVVAHSVGNRKKRAALAKADTQQRQARDEAVVEETLAVEVDGADAVRSESDVQDFLKALERRGFVLRNGSDSVDSSNKMFVSMELIKAGSPTKGKSADVRSSGPHKHKATKEADVASDDEAKTLKPCLYKLR